eukprot:TRINITY_DN4227_c0_g1_i1.p1 TRINITY_DN4227_c0_g1~~TRINITY_DN4227_c0_g1_i1.p1  ORF type:complete len:887 (+),score=350.16 TRINITY_DN4227_c0_g1_i1:67-2727(+)
MTGPEEEGTPPAEPGLEFPREASTPRVGGAGSQPSTPVIAVTDAEGAAAQERVVKWVVDQGLYLTGLEMYQELAERGVVIKELRRFVEDKTGEELLLNDVEQPEDREEALLRRVHALQKDNERMAKQLEELRRCKDVTMKEALGQEIHALHGKLKAHEHRERDTLHAIAERLPTVITSVRSSRKDSLLQILLTVIEHHPEPRVRGSLLFHYVTLFKRPDEEQRRQVGEGFAALAEKLAKTDPHRVEGELMGSIKGLEDCRYPEQKVLAVQLTISLYPHLSAHIKEDLRRMFDYWVDDPAGMVREAALAGAAALQLQGSFLAKGLGDASHRVQRAALRQAAPTYIALAREQGSLPALIDALVADLTAKPATPARKAAIEYAVQHLVDAVDQSTPPSLGTEEDPLAARLQKVIDRRLKGVWPAAEYFLEALPLTLLRGIAAAVPPQQDQAVDILSSAVMLSRAALHALVTPVFYELSVNGPASLPPPPKPCGRRAPPTPPTLDLLDREIDDPAADAPQKSPWGLLRAYVRYYMKTGAGGAEGGGEAHGSTGNVEKVGCEEGTLCDLFLTTITRHRDSPETLEDFCSALCQLSEEFMEIGAVVVDVLWNCLVDQHAATRRASVECVSAFLHRGCLPASLIIKRVVPALISLSTDECDKVKVGCVGCAAHLVSHPHDTPRDVVEKLGVAIRAACPAAGASDARASYLTTLVKYIPRMDAALLREHVAPVLLDTIDHATHEEDAAPSMLIPLVCECVRGVVHQAYPPQEKDALSPFVNALRRLLARDMSDGYLRSTVTTTVKELEAVIKSDHEQKKGPRVLAKFRDILPNVDAAPGAGKAAAHEGKHAAKESPKRSFAGESSAEETAAQPIPATQKMSILSKVQKKLFGAD